MHYLINLGNSRAAVLETAQLTSAEPPIAYYATGDFVAAWQPVAVAWSATAACVVPAVRRALDARWPGRIAYVGAADYPNVDFSAYGDGLGADRMANAAAARALNPKTAVLGIGVFLHGVHGVLNRTGPDGKTEVGPVFITQLDDDSIPETGEMLFEFIVPHIDVAEIEIGTLRVFHCKDLITP